MRDVIISNCEKIFVKKLVDEGHRLDGRKYNESRKLDISFGSEYGSCIVTLGDTKVLAQVSCEVTQPKLIRPNEGVLSINAEIGTMAGPQFESRSQSDLPVYLNRLLEKCYKDSKCLDLESLCIVVEEKVWSIRVDIKVLNHDSNLIECASVATLTSLAHFKRPDFTRNGDKITIHTRAEKDPIPTVLYHYPVCVTYAIISSHIIVSDPGFLEESLCTSSTEGIHKRGGLIVVGMNQYNEICLLNLTGAAIDDSNIVHKAIASAAEKCKDIVDQIKNAIANDNTLRQRRENVNFSNNITEHHLQSLTQRDLSIHLKRLVLDPTHDTPEVMSEDDDAVTVVEPSKYDVVSSAPQTVEVVAKKGSSQWIEISSESEQD